jgi:hypothetical protein
MYMSEQNDVEVDGCLTKDAGRALLCDDVFQSSPRLLDAIHLLDAIKLLKLGITVGQLQRVTLAAAAAILAKYFTFCGRNTRA